MRSPYFYRLYLKFFAALWRFIALLTALKLLLASVPPLLKGLIWSTTLTNSASHQRRGLNRLSVPTRLKRRTAVSSSTNSASRWHLPAKPVLPVRVLPVWAVLHWHYLHYYFVPVAVFVPCRRSPRQGMPQRLDNTGCPLHSRTV